MKKLIIDVRLNEYAMRDENPNVPWSPAEIATDAIECYEAGATSVHFHGRDGKTGAAANDFETYAQIIRGIRSKAPDVLVHSTLGYVTHEAAERKIDHILSLVRDPMTRPDVAPVDMATMNVDIYSSEKKAFITDDQVFYNPTRLLQYFTQQIQAAGVKTIHTCWNVPCTRTVQAFIEMGLIKGPAYIALLMSESGLLAGHPGNYKGLAAHLDFLPTNGPIEWIALVYPGSIQPVASMVIAEGGHLSFGLGDHPYLELGGKPRNADIVRHIVKLARDMGREIATPEEARAMLGMPQLLKAAAA
ncbi:3-keto-5-aminohexanoate cleavage protein [Labrys sp. KB_33_2]|uniref:3-keto-5-aminohexanoate cleavage protein n=1 Tax=Labrys sp. KB_33_2 TaxID=3237479 RepID=UPI003F900A50